MASEKTKVKAEKTEEKVVKTAKKQPKVAEKQTKVDEKQKQAAVEVKVEDVKGPVQEKPEDVFALLNSINVNERIEKKKVGGVELSYLSWVWAWGIVRKLFPDATYRVHLFGDNQVPYVYDENTGYMVFTSVRIKGKEHLMWLPVMDGANKSMKNAPYKYYVRNYRNPSQPIEKVCDAADMFDVNKTIMRCLAKNLAMFGLGLYIYAGEDLPMALDEGTSVATESLAAEEPKENPPKAPAKTPAKASAKAPAKTPVKETAEDAPKSVKDSIAELLAEKTKGMGNPEKREIVKTFMLPTLGVANYALSKDEEKLKQLLEQLQKFFNKGEGDEDGE